MAEELNETESLSNVFFSRTNSDVKTEILESSPKGRFYRVFGI